MYYKLKWTTPRLLWKSASGLRKKKLVGVVRCITEKLLRMVRCALSCEPTVSSPNDNQIDLEYRLTNSATIITRVTVQQVQGRQGQNYSGTGYKSNATSSGETMQVDRQGLLNATTVKNEDLDSYDSDCDDILNAKAVLMANISNYGSDVILEKAQQIKLTLYDVIIISDKDIVVHVIDDEETLILEEFRISNPTIKSSNKPPVNVEVPSELPKVSLVNASLTKLTFNLTQFDSVVKKRTTPNAYIEEYFENNDLKAQLQDKDIGCPNCSLVSGLQMLKTYDREPLLAPELSCALGKSKKSSHQPKAEDTNQEKLYLLHMDLCVASINGKRCSPNLAGERTTSIHFYLDDLVSKFINQFFPPSKTTYLRNEITYFQQRFDESFSDAWDRFKDLLRACPHHGFSKLHQLDTFYNALNSKDQDSLNSVVGGNFLDKKTRECLAIIENKSKVCYSRNKPVVAKVSTNTSTSGISPDVAELKDMVKALLLDKKSQNQSLTLVKAVEENCVTCSGAHSYRNCPATDGNIYRDNIQEFISQASAVNYNQGNTSYRPPMMSNQIRPPGFPPVPNNQNVQRNNQNCFIPNQNRGNNFNLGLVYQPPVFQPPAYQAPAYQAPAPQTQCVSKEDLSAYVKANDVVMRNMQTQGQNMQNQLTSLTYLITKFMNSNSASTSSSGTLPSNTIDNLRSDLKVITTRSGVSYDGPQIPPQPSFLPRVVENEQEPVTSPISEPAIALASASKPNPKTLIPYPPRRNDERNREKANNQIEKFYQIFKDMSFKISFVDALILMPKFTSTLNALIRNKERLSEMARTLLNEHCSAVLLKKLPKKLRDPCKFLIPCDFPGMAECLSLTDLGASINLMPFSVWKRLSLPDLTPTCMTLELADHSISRPVGVAEDVYVKVGSFHFLTAFVVVDFDADPRVPLILGRSFLKIGRALIDVFEGSFGFSNTISSGNPTPFYDLIVSMTSPTLTSFENSDFLLEEVDAFLAIEDEPTSSKFYQPYLDHEGDILLLESFLNDDPSLPPPNQGNYLPEFRKELKICEAKSKKYSVDEPQVVELKDLPPHLEYAFFEGDDKLPVIIAKDLSVEENTALIMVLKSHKRAIA
uniref:Retrotransposon gag domain-containing protein n=1 Tax=Tanacetum cinerariifolium TaxID=118510 RepID=A0A699GQV9_TANCI|nr:hypothetical protein [Tanacetum cinerariifolium]